MRWHVTDRCAVIAVALVAVAGTVLPAWAEHEVDVGWVDGGVSSEEEARAYPCSPMAAGGWERTGPVVCLDRRTDQWRLTAETARGCTRDATGWHGDCVFDIDMGDHVRVWGTRGVLSVRFEVTWLHTEPAQQDPRPSPAVSPDDGEAGGQSPGSSDPSPQPPPRPPEPPSPPPAPPAASGEPGQVAPGSSSADPVAAPAAGAGAGPTDDAVLRARTPDPGQAAEPTAAGDVGEASTAGRDGPTSQDRRTGPAVVAALLVALSGLAVGSAVRRRAQRR